MRVLVAWGSKRGGTEGIARIVAEELQRNGIDTVVEQASAVRDLGGYDAAIIGGSLYANLWHAAARRLVSDNVAALRRIPVWLFSSGPLDDTADRNVVPPAAGVAGLMERIGAVGHQTFGGRLSSDAKGFPASAMAKNRSGDWRNPERIRAWAANIAKALPTARPGTAIDPPGGSVWRLAGYGIAGWAACAVVMAALLAVVPLWLALTVHAIAAPLIFVALSVRYFGARGAWEPLPTAVAFTLIVVVFDAVVVAGVVLRSFEMFTSLAGAWLPFALVFLATWITGLAMAMMPAKSARRSQGAPATARTAS